MQLQLDFSSAQFQLCSTCVPPFQFDIAWEKQSGNLLALSRGETHVFEIRTFSKTCERRYTWYIAMKSCAEKCPGFMETQYSVHPGRSIFILFLVYFPFSAKKLHARSRPSRQKKNIRRNSKSKIEIDRISKPWKINEHSSNDRHTTEMSCPLSPQHPDNYNKCLWGFDRMKTWPKNDLDQPRFCEEETNVNFCITLEEHVDKYRSREIGHVAKWKSRVKARKYAGMISLLACSFARATLMSRKWWNQMLVGHRGVERKKVASRMNKKAEEEETP